MKPGTDPDNPGARIIESVVSASKTLLAELTSGTKYYGRVRTIGAKGIYGDWSDVSSKRCP